MVVDGISAAFQPRHPGVDLPQTSKDRKKFDFIDTCSHVLPYRNGFDKVPERDEEQCERLWRFFHNEIPPEHRAWLEVMGWVPLDDVLVDDLGDAFNEPPHILVSREHEYGFFAHTRAFVELDHGGPREAIPAEELRKVKLFPNPIPDVEWKQGW